jgi:putative transposase
MGRPPRIPVWLRWERSVIYFVTIGVAHRRAVLANDETLEALKTAATKLRHWKILAAILMPDHLHVIVTPTRERSAQIGNFSAALKRWIRKELNASWQWQSGCFDRLLRSDESLHDKWLYIQNNPVRAGLVTRSEDWRYRIGFDDQDD